MLVSPANHGSDPRGNGRSGANRGNNLGAGRGFATRLCRVSRQRKRKDRRFTSMLASSSPMEGADELGRDRRHGRVTEKSGSRRRFPLRLPDERRSDQAYVPGTEWRTQGMQDATSQVIGGDTAGPDRKS